MIHPPATTLDAAGVPDVSEAILGWRTWRVGRRAQRRAELVAPLAQVIWPARRAMVATCGSSSHEAPGDRCRCGLYAVHDPGTLEWGPSDFEVMGVVALWGQVVEGSRGWRASHGYPRFLVTGPAIPAEQRAALARRYGVPVHGADLPARALARQLGGDPLATTLLRSTETEALLAAHMAEWARRWHDRQARLEAGRGSRFRPLARVWRR
ncbi:hypothetical protein [Actinomycetospora aeridis]|uniref:Uncharacterized protein n=1 Tax=Actinomycetospora aeridis TaxID=3129231 RepID=A0ABU8NCW4_9PSEU